MKKETERKAEVRDLAYCRSGDKGDISNVGVLALKPRPENRENPLGIWSGLQLGINNGLGARTGLGSFN